MQIDMMTWQDTYFDYFGGSNMNGVYYPADSEVFMFYIDRAEAGSGQTVTFTEYPVYGWLGYCTSEECEGEEPRSVVTGFTYDATETYFVYYATSDAID